jgi:predicted permease
VPPPLRARWREEWLAEIAAAASGQRAPILRRALGAPIDALMTRRAAAASGGGQHRSRWSPLLPGRTDWLLAWRQMRRAPVVNTAAVLALAVGIGLTLVAWTVVRGVFHRPLPGPQGSDIYRVTDYDRAGGFGLDVDLHEFERRRALTTLAGLGAFNERPVAVGPADRSRVVIGAFVTTNTFRLLGVTPLAGRDLHDDDSRADGADSILIREPLAVREFGSVPAAVGATLEVDGRPRRVAGVIPANCRFPFISDLWIPFATTIAEGAPPERSLRMFGRLDRDATLESASRDMHALMLTAPARPNRDQLSVLIVPFGRPPGPPEQQLVAWSVIVVFALLLAVAAATVAHLMLARALARRHELAVCVALGASRRRLIVQLATEALAIGLAAAAAGTLGAGAALQWLQRTIPDLPYWVTFAVDGMSLLVVAALTVLATAVAGIVPALRATAPGAALTIASRTSTVRFGWFGSALIAAELAVAVGFLAAAASLGRGLLEIGQQSYALPMNEVAVSQLYYGAPAETQKPAYASLPPLERQAIWRAHAQRAVVAQRQLAGQLRELPGVRGAALASHFPGNESPVTPVAIDRDAGATSGARVVEVGDGYFTLLDARLLAGRDFSPSELETLAPVAVVNEPFARRRFGTPQVIGRQIRIETGAEPRPWRTIVGVVPDLGLSPAAPSRSDAIYVPLQPTTVIRVGVRRLPDPRVVTPAIHRMTRVLEPPAAVQWSQTLADQLAEPVLLFRGLGGSVLAMGAVALLLACTGIHALVAFAVAQRRREIAIRVALGAAPGEVARAVMGRTMWQLAAGAIAGAAIAFLLDAAIQRPFDLERIDALGLGGVFLLLLVAALAASIGPLRRALAVGPAETLRN